MPYSEKKNLRRSMSAEIKHTYTGKELPNSGVYEVNLLRRRGSAGDIMFVCSIPPGFGDFQFPASLATSLVVIKQAGYNS